MLIELNCDVLVEKKINFSKGLNVLVGPDGGTNSIGKSSVLMLIDFALAGDDFTKLCSGVVDAVGDFYVYMVFEFDGDTYEFSRGTIDPAVINYITSDGVEAKSIGEYRSFLQKMYKFPDDSTSFRGCLNTFTRVWGKENYNTTRPLNSFPSEPFSKIMPRLLKMFGCYGGIKEIEVKKRGVEKKKSNLKGAFEVGLIKPLTKVELRDARDELSCVVSSLDKLKGDLELYALGIREIVNEKSLGLKQEKDSIVDVLYHAKGHLSRIESNLNFGSSVSRRYFNKLKEYFPSVDEEKLLKVDEFHSGVGKILKAEIKKERDNIKGQIEVYEGDLKSVNESLSEIVGVKDSPTDLLDEVLALSLKEKSLRDKIRYRELKDSIDEEVNSISEDLSGSLIGSLNVIEESLNAAMAGYVGRYYDGNPVSPEVHISEGRYKFINNDDSGTGKAYANMIAMDMSFLEMTYLPLVIHDLILFKNIETHAIEKIISEYSKSNKQVFISLDEIPKYSKDSQVLILKSEFLRLGSDRLAFGKSWKNK